MPKTFAFSLIALTLIFSILAPSFATLLDKDCKIAIVLDSEEEQNEEQKSEKKLDKKELFFSNSIENRSLSLTQESIKNHTYLLFYSDISTEIILPPPRYLI